MRPIDADALKEDLTRFYAGEVTARDLIDEQPTIGGWISVKDRLPKKNGYYIVYTKDGLMWPYFFRGDCWEDGLGFRTETVTHWITLREPPKEEEDAAD